jgi:hypothetical protein
VRGDVGVSFRASPSGTLHGNRFADSDVQVRIEGGNARPTGAATTGAITRIRPERGRRRQRPAYELRSLSGDLETDPARIFRGSPAMGSSSWSGTSFRSSGHDGRGPGAVRTTPEGGPCGLRSAASRNASATWSRCATWRSRCHRSAHTLVGRTARQVDTESRRDGMLSPRGDVRGTLLTRRALSVAPPAYVPQIAGAAVPAAARAR